MKENITLSQMKVMCSRILRHYGALNQINKCKEELEELNKELSSSTNVENIQSEIADVLIMSVQMALLFGWDKTVETIEFKLKRQEGRMHYETLKK